MLIRDIMTRAVITVAPGETLENACNVMHERNIRHLPVVERGALIGVITDRDLGGTASAPCLGAPPPSGLVRDVMVTPVRTATPLDPVEDAARVMRSSKIGCLPVVDGGELVGIVTGIDLLDALLRLTGVDAPSGRIEVVLIDRINELARLTEFLALRGLPIHSLLGYPEEGGGTRVVVRVGTLDTRGLAEALRGSGFSVSWPPEKPWRH